MKTRADMNRVDVDYGDLNNTDFLVKLDLVANEVLEHIGRDECHMSINIVSDKDMQKFNKAYRGIDSTTDVLSFAFEEDNFFSVGDFSKGELGEIYISLKEVFSNAQQYSISKNQELARVTIHGTLHLLGFDHESNDMQNEPMLKLQEEILKKIEKLWKID